MGCILIQVREKLWKEAERGDIEGALGNQGATSSYTKWRSQNHAVEGKEEVKYKMELKPDSTQYKVLPEM